MSKGQNLALELGIKCNQALYSAWGNFYAPIAQYPCALFDKNGFVVVNSEKDCQLLGIKLGKRTNIPTLISTLPGYKRIESLRIGITEEVWNESISPEIREGAIETITLIVTKETGVDEAYVLLIMGIFVQPVIRNYPSFMVRLPIASFTFIISFPYLQSTQNTASIQSMTFGLCALIATQLLIFVRSLTRLKKFVQ